MITRSTAAKELALHDEEKSIMQIVRKKSQKGGSEQLLGPSAELFD